MKVLYNNSEIKNGVFMTPIETHGEPKIEYDPKPNTLYTLIMHDPDAPVGNLLHWIVVNIDGNSINNGDTLLEYKGPAPPKGSGSHRYMFLLLEQPEKITSKLDERVMPMDNLYKKLNTKLQTIANVYFTSKNLDGGNGKSKKKSLNSIYMSSLKSYLRKQFGTTHKYETQADLKDMSAEQIVRLNPGDVGHYIANETGGIPLAGKKKLAMITLLSIKRHNKATPNESARQGAITRFLRTEGIEADPEVDKLIADTHTEMMTEQLESKDMTNRLRALNDKPPIPDTEDESMARRLQNLRAGGKRKRKTVSKRTRRVKTIKGRKPSRKTNKKHKKQGRNTRKK